MTKRLVEIDDVELQLARDAGNYATIKETVAAGLRELTAASARRREVARLTSGALALLAEKGARQDVWR